MSNIRRLQDVQINDVDLIETYKNTFNNESITTAQSLINTDKLKSYTLQSEWMNDLKTEIEKVEGYKVTDCDNVFTNDAEEFQLHIDALLYVGEYNEYVQYYKNNCVSYNEEVYLCIKNSLNKIPTNTTYWVKVGLKGEKGNYDLGVKWHGIWDYNIVYHKYDLISYNNNLYIAKKSNINSRPIPINIYYLNDNLYLDDDFYLRNNDSYSGETMEFLNNSLYLNDSFYLRNSRSDNDWFMLTELTNMLQLYFLPEDYTQLPIHSIFFENVIQQG